MASNNGAEVSAPDLTVARHKPRRPLRSPQHPQLPSAQSIMSPCQGSVNATAQADGFTSHLGCKTRQRTKEKLTLPVTKVTRFTKSGHCGVWPHMWTPQQQIKVPWEMLCAPAATPASLSCSPPQRTAVPSPAGPWGGQQRGWLVVQEQDQRRHCSRGLVRTHRAGRACSVGA